MSTYRVHFTTTASASVEVEADDIDEAYEMAYDELPSGVCAQCSGWNQTWGLDLAGDWDADEQFYTVDGAEVEVKR